MHRSVFGQNRWGDHNNYFALRALFLLLDLNRFPEIGDVSEHWHLLRRNLRVLGDESAHNERGIIGNPRIGLSPLRTESVGISLGKLLVIHPR